MGKFKQSGGSKGAFGGCKWCGGRGCLQCPSEKLKADVLVVKTAIHIAASTPPPSVPFVPRYDEEKKIYRDCPICKGKGCPKCPEECDKEYDRQFPNGPQPFATFNTTTQDGRDSVRAALGDEIADVLIMKTGVEPS